MRIHTAKRTLTQRKHAIDPWDFHTFLLEEAPENLPADIDRYIGVAVLHADWVESLLVGV